MVQYLEDCKGSILTGHRLTDQSVVLIIKDCLRLAGIEKKIFQVTV